ncbi:hypothetical protein BGZ65_005662, partial [Modicella reniformis]
MFLKSFASSSSSFTRTTLRSARVFQRCYSAAVSDNMRNQFLVVVHDQTDAGAFDRRLAVRPVHLIGAKKLKESGTLQFGGPILTDHSESGKMRGSALIVRAESEEAVKKIIEG